MKHVASLLLLWLLLAGATAGDLISPACPELLRQMSDLRGLHRGWRDLDMRIAEKQCLVDVVGMVTDRGGAPIASTTRNCTNRLSVGSVLQQLNLEYGHIGGVQIRIFKKNEIIQSPRVVRGKTSEEERIKNTILEPGDVVFFTGQE